MYMMEKVLMASSLQTSPILVLMKKMIARPQILM